MNKREVIKGIVAAVLKGKDDLAFKMLDDFGCYVWGEAQKSAAKPTINKKKSLLGKPDYSTTPYCIK